MTHPGIPCMFYDDLQDRNMKDLMRRLIALRQAAGIHCRSKVQCDYAAPTRDSVLSLLYSPACHVLRTVQGFMVSSPVQSMSSLRSAKVFPFGMHESHNNGVCMCRCISCMHRSFCMLPK